MDLLECAEHPQYLTTVLKYLKEKTLPIDTIKYEGQSNMKWKFFVATEHMNFRCRDYEGDSGHV